MKEDAMVGGSSWDISWWSVSSSSLLRVLLLGVEELGIGVWSKIEERLSRRQVTPPKLPPLPRVGRSWSCQHVFEYVVIFMIGITKQLILLILSSIHCFFVITTLWIPVFIVVRCSNQGWLFFINNIISLEKCRLI